MSSELNSRENVLINVPTLHPLGGLTRDEYISKLSELLSGQVEEAFVFGSISSDNFSKDSDVDLILVVDTDLDFFNRFRLFPGLFDLTPRLDLLIYTPKEFERIKAQAGTGFWKSVFESAVKII